MSKGTDGQILSKREVLITKTKGRPRVNRELGKRLLLAGYSTEQISKALKCGHKTIYRMRDELIAKGELTNGQLKEADTPLIEADFDSECIRATGTSFKTYLSSKRKKYQQVFSFCSKVWDQVWDKPSLVLVKDADNPLADKLIELFNVTFGEDSERIRTRKKHIRTLFRFLGRSDINDKSLTMTNSRDPRSIRRIPQIEMMDFPSKVQACLNELNDYERLVIMFKIVTQMRTGDRKEERALEGMRKGSGKSYLLMDNEDSFRCHVVEKMREEWDITHIPKEIRKELYKLYLTREDGAYIFDQTYGLVKKWKAITMKNIGIDLTLHDSRKISVTWFYACGLPLEIATSLNVGWKDLNTPRDHYLHLRQLLKKSQKAVYVSNIPGWFKEGLNEYMED